MCMGCLKGCSHLPFFQPGLNLCQLQGTESSLCMSSSLRVPIWEFQEQPSKCGRTGKKAGGEKTFIIRLLSADSYHFGPHTHACLAEHAFRMGRGYWAAARLLWRHLISIQNKWIRHVEIQLPDPSLSNIRYRERFQRPPHTLHGWLVLLKSSGSANIHLIWIGQLDFYPSILLFLER